jgi:hypothetical protein
VATTRLDVKRLDLPILEVLGVPRAVATTRLVWAAHS